MRRINYHKKITILFLMLLVSFFAISICGAAETKVRVISQTANVRIKPNINSQVIAKVNRGLVLEVIEKIDDWYKVNLPPDESGVVISGYISQSVVELIEETPAVIKKEPEAEPIISKSYLKSSYEKNSNIDYLDWQKRYKEAKAKKKNALMLSVAGASVSILGTVFIITDKSKEFYCDFWHCWYEENTKKGYLALIAAGAGLAIVGAIMQENAKDDIRNLEQEATRKNYKISFKFGPIIKGLKCNLAIKF